MKQVKLKIIAGKYKNRPLVSYSDATRETSSLVRGAVFNSLYQVNGLGLDLFGGSGAYGYEALSRGLEKVYINDVDKLAYRSIFENKQTLNTNEQAIISNLDYKDAINKYSNQKLLFDYIFLDPPYNMTGLVELFDQLEFVSKQDSIVVLEVMKLTVVADIYGSFVKQKEKIHGIKKISIFKKMMINET